MRVPETAYGLFVWSAAAAVGAALLLWLWEILVGLVLVGSVLYAAIHLLIRFGKWYTDTHVSDNRAPPSVSLRSPSTAVPSPTLSPRGPAMTPDEPDLSGVPEDEARWQPDTQLDDAARALADQELDNYYRDLADERHGCAVDRELEAEESRLQAAEEAMDGAAEGLGTGEDEDGRW